jgi:hypothetical protein
VLAREIRARATALKTQGLIETGQVFDRIAEDVSRLVPQPSEDAEKLARDLDRLAFEAAEGVSHLERHISGLADQARRLSPQAEAPGEVWVAVRHNGDGSTTAHAFASGEDLAVFLESQEHMTRCTIYRVPVHGAPDVADEIAEKAENAIREMQEAAQSETHPGDAHWDEPDRPPWREEDGEYRADWRELRLVVRPSGDGEPLSFFWCVSSGIRPADLAYGYSRHEPEGMHCAEGAARDYSETREDEDAFQKPEGLADSRLLPQAQTGDEGSSPMGGSAREINDAFREAAEQDEPHPAEVAPDPVTRLLRAAYHEAQRIDWADGEARIAFGFIIDAISALRDEVRRGGALAEEPDEPDEADEVTELVSAGLQQIEIAGGNIDHLGATQKALLAVAALANRKRR